MKQKTLSIGATALIAVAGLIIATNMGLIGIEWPWEKVALPEVLTEETVVEQPEVATVYEIQPIALDCRARILAEVPVVGKREHKAFGKVYRTDTVSLTAKGDIDTCVDSSETTIHELEDGRFQVIVPATAITFERPRVDAVATRDSVEFDKGLLGKFSDLFPWVSDNSGLTPAAYAYAQEVVGSSECMARAWTVTETVVKKAYGDQLVAQGGQRADVSVVIEGAPEFGDAPGAEIAEFDFEVGDDAVNCVVDGSAYIADELVEADAV